MDYVPPREDFFRSPATELAPALIGCLLKKESSGGPVSGVIVETEAYTRDDPASHSYGGMTARNRTMFQGGGLAYVYMIYGVHNCFNVTSGLPGTGQAVLVRAVRPVQGIDIMRANRGLRDIRRLCRGPGMLCQAFGMDRSLNGTSLIVGDVRILVPRVPVEHDISCGMRVGISRGREMMRRYFLNDSEWVSRIRV
ncbi:MAG: DNA-3-methyladenine glycosylase [Candidatus Fermentibacteraceae bacterium]|nr:DNA-3-methyladenine glycosylase [Candidatus Fermentibacteraceae bacterium]